MALRFTEGFDWNTTIAEQTRKWTSFSSGTSGLSINTSTPLTGTGSFRIATNGTGIIKTIDSQQTWVVGLRIRFDTTLREARCIHLRDGTTIQATLRFNADGTVSAMRSNSVVLGTSASVITSDTVHYVEAKVLISDTVGTFDIQVDGVNVLSLTSQDTKQSANATADTILIGAFTSGAAATLDIDDLYVADGTGSIRNDFLGPQKVYTILPDGNGNSSQFTGSDADSTDNYLLVDEADTDDDTTYVESSTVGHRDDYAFAAIPLSLPTINGVSINALAKKDDAGTRTLDFYTRISATNYDAAYNGSLAESYENHQYIWEQNPDDSADWANADVDGATFGHEVAS